MEFQHEDKTQPVQKRRSRLRSQMRSNPLQPQISELAQGFSNENEPSFIAIVQSSLSTGIPVSNFADEFKISVPAYTRWGEGKNLPVKLIRTNIVKRILNLVRSHQSDESRFGISTGS